VFAISENSSQRPVRILSPRSWYSGRVHFTILAARTRKVSGPQMFRKEGDFGRRFKGHFSECHLQVRVLHAQPVSPVSGGVATSIEMHRHFRRLAQGQSVSAAGSSVFFGRFPNFCARVSGREFPISEFCCLRLGSKTPRPVRTRTPDREISTEVEPGVRVVRLSRPWLVTAAGSIPRHVHRRPAARHRA
jgi:hypothetical protein